MSAESTSNAEDSDALHRLQTEFEDVVRAYNSAIATGKLKTIQAAVKPTHDALFAISRAAHSSHVEALAFRKLVDTAITDVRWGTAIARETPSGCP